MNYAIAFVCGVFAAWIVYRAYSMIKAKTCFSDEEIIEEETNEEELSND